MKNLPIKKGIEESLQKETNGVWDIKSKHLYLKSASRSGGWNSPVEIPIYKCRNQNEALKYAILCAKVYKKFIQEGLYHPETQVVIYKDEQENHKGKWDILTLMVVMPELEVEKQHSKAIEKLIHKRIRNVKKNLNLKNRLDLDMYLFFNWGYDKKTHEHYAHDLHLVYNDSYSTNVAPYKRILKMADQMGIK